ncbi:Pleckstrin homology domain [Teratosphaeria destructans]|uniref:Pleckstrin homology domain n=1 Tax=Teratosphaeria destructans TaxID=418781 RepID=A0A9W7SNI6_9PEZI|nr:Pleckstrin homology domain [Teratosphaeria destructans]
MDTRSSSAAGPSSSSSPNQPTSPIAPSKRMSSRHALATTTYQDGIGEPPTTPPNNSRITKSRAASKGKEPVHRPETARGQASRQDNNDEVPRHSHGLSWSSTTRDSVVDNLLLSLGNLSNQNLGGSGIEDARNLEFDRQKYLLPTMPQFPQFQYTKPVTRPRTHTYSSSMSSGYDGYGNLRAESPDSKHSEFTAAKAQSSESGSTLGAPSIMDGRIQVPQRFESKFGTELYEHARNSRHTKDSSSDMDSADYGYSSVIDTTRLGWGGRRSFSMDQMYDTTSTAATQPSMLDRGRPRYDTLDEGAPEPGIPAGPRNKLNPEATGPVYVNRVPSRQSIRKINTQSDLRAASKQTQGQPIPQYIHDQASDFVRLNSMRSTPSGQDSAPAPGPGMRSVRKDEPSPQRERPGFFKRVFGSGNSRVASSLSDRSDPQETIGYPDKASAPNRARSTASTATIQQPRESTASTGYPPPPQNLNKKPSSFFRRRKKSGSGMAPPPLPLNIGGANANGMTVEPSPSASSLRKVMDPYLAREAGAADSKRGHVSNLPSSVSELDVFQPGYGAAPDASFADTMPRIGEGTEDSPKMKIKIKKRNDENMASTMLQPPIDATFLHDSSRRPSSSTLSDRFTPPAVVDPSISPLFDPPLSDRRTVRSVSRASTGDRIIASESLSEPTTTLEKTVSKEERRNFSAENNINLNPQDEGWLVMHRRSGESATEAHRLVLKPTEAEETQNDEPEPTPSLSDSQNGSRAGSLAVSSLNKSAGVSSIYHSATSLPLPSVQLEGKDMVRSSIETTTPPVPAVKVDESAEHRERARRIFDGDEEDVTKAEAAAWLGERNTLSMRTLNAYMQLFDFTGMSILAALRILAGKLLLKGETQQFDRIITALSERWCECNTMHGFKAQDVVHTILYSLILLNTDLHLADIGEKMSKSAYVKNTLPTIRRVVADAAPNAFEDHTVKLSPIGTRPPIPWSSSDLPGPRLPSLYPETSTERTSFEPSSNKRLSGRPGVIRTESDGWTPDSANAGASIALIAQTWSGSMRGWEAEVEAVLKSFYNSIRSDPLPMYGAPTDVFHPERNLAVSSQFASVKRSGSVVSKTPSDNVSYRSRAGLRTMTMGWQSRMNRSRPKLYPASTLASSRTSFDDNNSLWSPAQSSRSKTSFAKTLTSASMNSLNCYLSPSSADLKHSIGFASALSQAIIREESAFAADGESMSVPAGLLEDEALALEGAPWAKEGLVKHKHHLEASEKKVKSNWNDCFAVIGKGKLTLFAFGSSNKSQSTGRKALQRNQRGRAGSVTAQRVGGGDWMENAEQLDAFVLRQTIASVLPVPGYSKARPHVWALSLPSGAVHLFQVGTAEIANEFMTSANYWAARLSKEPLSGSVSNIEYGWSDQAINPALLQNRPESAFAGPPPSMNNPNVARHMHSSSGGSNMQRPSYQSSMRSSFDTGFGNNKMKLPGDRIQIADWQPPTQSMMASQLLEVDQLKQLTAYVQNVEAELAKHNELKHAIELAYSPRNNNYTKAMTNWQKKSEYLLREAVKFTKYTDSLTAAQTAKEDVYARKAEQDSSTVGSPTESLRMRDERDITPRPRSLIRPDSPRPPMTAH